jgi:hypothetical protein
MGQAMENSTADKRREILIFLLTAIVIAFLVGGIATILFSAPFLAVTHPWWTLCGSIILLIIATSFLYIVLISSVRRLNMQVRFPLAFDRVTCLFVDLPYCPMSVNARVCFDKLPDPGRRHLACYDTIPGFFGSELNRFIDHVVQGVLLTRVVFQRERGDSTKKGYMRLRGGHLPLGVIENRFFADWVDELNRDRTVIVPHLKQIQTFGRNNSFFRINTKGGTLEFSWQIVYDQTPYYSKAFLPLQADTDYRFHDYEVTVALLRTCSALRIFSASVRDFVDWASGVEKKLATYDWSFSQNDRLLYLIAKVRQSEGDAPADGN